MSAKASVKSARFMALAAALAVLSGPAHGALVAPVAAGVGGWVSAVVGAVATVGTERVGALGSPALTALSRLDASGRPALAVDPKLLTPLARALEEAGVTPETFAALPSGEKLAVLKTAASAASARSARVADAALAAADRPLRFRTMSRTSAQISEAEALSVYLDDARRERVAQASAKVREFETKWRAEVDEFAADLPRKLAAGEINASNIFTKTGDGWVVSDESPAPNSAPLGLIYRLRLAKLESSPMGPWTLQEIRVLTDALDRPDVAASVEDGRGSAESLRAELQGLGQSARRALQNDRPLQLARAAFQKNARTGANVSPRHIKIVEDRYALWANQTAHADSMSIRMRFLVWARQGEAEGLPSWPRLEQLRGRAQARAWLVVKAMTGVFLLAQGALIAAGATGAMAAFPSSIKPAVFLTWALIAAFWSLALKRLQSFEKRPWLYDVFQERLRTAFPQDWPMRSTATLRLLLDRMGVFIPPPIGTIVGKEDDTGV